MLNGREKKECIGGNCHFDNNDKQAPRDSLLVHYELIRKGYGAFFGLSIQKRRFVGEAISSRKSMDDYSLFFYFFD